MKQYLDSLRQVMKHGVDREGRNGGTRSVFGMQHRYNMADGFPAVTTKKLFFRGVKAELLWFLSGSSDVRDLQKRGCHIWDQNAEADYWLPKARFEGDLGRIYGVQWRSWMTYEAHSSTDAKPKFTDQIAELIQGIETNPYGRRHIITAWNPGELDRMALPPCHLLAQFYVEPYRGYKPQRGKQRLSVQMYQRSDDLFLGSPFNIASYALLLHMVAQVVGMVPGDFIHTLGDAHIYHNHFEQVEEQLSREPKQLPQLWLNPDISCIDDFDMDDIKLIGYNYHPPIKAEMSV